MLVLGNTISAKAVCRCRESRQLSVKGCQQLQNFLYIGRLFEIVY